MRKMVAILSFVFSFVVAADTVVGNDAEKIWNAMDFIAKAEKVNLIEKTEKGYQFSIDNLSCVFENYNACSFMGHIQQKRQLIVDLDGATLLMNALANAGVLVDEEMARMDLKSLFCTNEDNEISCEFE